MAGFLKSKFFVILLSVTLAIVIISSVLSLCGVTPIIRNALGSVVAPFEWVGNSVANGIRGFGAYFTDFDELEDENDALRAENEELRERLRESELAENENKWLRRYLGLKSENMSFSLLDASVIGYEAGNYRTVFTVNRGSAHGVEEGMAVISSEGIIGYVSEVGLSWSKIVTLIETATAVGAYVERSGELGIVEGDIGMKTQGICKMVYLPDDADIKVGDTILTSGLGSIYPAGLVVGEVEAIEKDEYARQLVATVRPNVDLSDIDKVMIITDYHIDVE